MSRKNGKYHQNPPRFRTGDWVRWNAGKSVHTAVVIGDHGDVGEESNRIYDLREFSLWTDVREYGMLSELLEPTERPEKLPEPHDKIPVLECAIKS